MTEKPSSTTEWTNKFADELHKDVRKTFKKRRVISPSPGWIWASDLAIISKFSRQNSGVNYLLMIIDVFSKVGHIKTLKTKKVIAKPSEDLNTPLLSGGTGL